MRNKSYNILVEFISFVIFIYIDCHVYLYCRISLNLSDLSIFIYLSILYFISFTLLDCIIYLVCPISFPVVLFIWIVLWISIVLFNLDYPIKKISFVLFFNLFILNSCLSNLSYSFCSFCCNFTICPIFVFFLKFIKCLWYVSK